MEKLIAPCSYQGGKSRIANKIADIIIEETDLINKGLKFVDICCGSGAVSMEMMNRGVMPENITMIDKGCFGDVWKSIGKNNFKMDNFKETIEKIPKDLGKINEYLKKISENDVVEEKIIYDYIILQAGAFGSKQIYRNGKVWKNNSFRNYWTPTENSSRKSPVNPMMPMPDTLYKRMSRIVEYCSGKIEGFNCDVFEVMYVFDLEEYKNCVVYIDPPYEGTTGYKDCLDLPFIIGQIWNTNNIYVSEGKEMCGSEKSYLISHPRKKGNISGKISKHPTEEWLNKF